MKCAIQPDPATTRSARSLFPAGTYVKSAVAADLPGLPAPHDQAEERIHRIKVLHGEFRKGTIDLLLVAYRLGIELKALREQTEHGEWEGLFRNRLRFIAVRTASEYISLAKAFVSEEQLGGLTLTQAIRWARKILGGAGKRRPRGRRKRARKGFLSRCEAFQEYLDRRELGEAAAQATARECELAMDRLAGIARAVARRTAEFERRCERLRLRLIGSANGEEETREAL